MCPIYLSNSCLSLGIFSRRRYHFDKTFHITDKSIRKVDCYKRRRKIKYSQAEVAVRRSQAIQPTKYPNLPRINRVAASYILLREIFNTASLTRANEPRLKSILPFWPFIHSLQKIGIHFATILKDPASSEEGHGAMKKRLN